MLGVTHLPVPALWKEILTLLRNDEKEHTSAKKKVKFCSHKFRISCLLHRSGLGLTWSKLFQIGMAMSMIDDAREFWEHALPGKFFELGTSEAVSAKVVLESPVATYCCQWSHLNELNKADRNEHLTKVLSNVKSWCKLPERFDVISFLLNCQSSII